MPLGSIPRRKITLAPSVEEHLQARLEEIKKTIGNVEQTPVATWLTPREKVLLYLIAKQQRVSIAAYLRAVIIDVIDEEAPKLKGMVDHDYPPES